MPDYSLTPLGSRAFEQMVTALARLELGPGVKVFGDGRDGGREATFDGTINWSATSAPEVATDAWTGFTVLQSKFHLKPAPEPIDNAKWLQSQIRKEITDWREAAENHTRERLPDYLIFITNVDLSPVAKTGGIDTLNQYVRKLLNEKSRTDRLYVRDFAIWHADQIRSMLDAHQSVRTAFPGLITVGDVLSRQATGSGLVGSLLPGDALREEVLSSLKADRWVRLSQSGGPGEAKLWLEDVVIDLPARTEDHTVVQAVQHVLEVGDLVLRQKQPDRITHPNLVLVGGPGQGKSTLSQMIAQSYRVSLLTGQDLGPTAAEIVQGTQAALDRLGLPCPGNRRWPVRIDLAKYAKELSSKPETSLMRWIAADVTQRSSHEVPAHAIQSWLRTWPWALILDGLDEVPSLDSRRLVYERIDDLLGKAEDLDADLLVVVTTRPTGYDERFDATRFAHLDLQRLPADEAAAFAKQITSKRLVGDDAMRLLVTERIANAAHDPETQQLMATPLQVMVMSFIAEKFPHLPPDRFHLFDLYYRTMFEREAGKDIPIARFLTQHRTHIDRLHESVGLQLQSAAESGFGADAVMTTEALRNLAMQQYLDRGFDTASAGQNADELVEAATHRLVLLVPRDEGVGFDIRTLQELMAARALTEGEDSEALERLQAIAHHPHWRNTWLLAIGRVIEHERFEKKIIALLKAIDDDPQRLGNHFPLAPVLAANILNDNLAEQRPRFERDLLAVLRAVLDRPPVRGLDAIGHALVRITDHDHHRASLKGWMSAAATGSASARAATGLVLRAMRSHTDKPGRIRTVDIAEQTLHLTDAEVRAIDSWLEPASDRNGLTVTEVPAYLNGLIAETDQSHGTVALCQAIGQALNGRLFAVEENADSAALLLRPDGPSPLASLERVMHDEDSAAVLDSVLGMVPSQNWCVPALLGSLLFAAQDREPVGTKLLGMFRSAKGEPV